VAAQGTFGFLMNNTGRAVNDVIVVNETSVRIQVSILPLDNPYQFFAVDATLTFGDYLRISGDYVTGPASVAGATLIGAVNVEIFLGLGPYRREDGSINPDALGLLIGNAQIGVVSFKGTGGAQDTFALRATGTASIVGLGNGLIVTGQITALINCTGRTINEQVQIPGVAETFALSFSSAEDVETFSGTNIVISLANVVSLRGDVTFTRDLSGTVHVSIPNARLSILPDQSGKAAFGINGAARFTIGGSQGFQLQDLQVNGFSIFGVDATLAPRTTPVIYPLTAALSNPRNGAVVDVDVLNDGQHRYIEISYDNPNGCGLDQDSITDDDPEFLLSINGHTPDYYGIDISNQGVRQGQSNVYRYSYTYTAPSGTSRTGPFQAGDVVEIGFLPTGWADTSGAESISRLEGFTVAAKVNGQLPPPPPAATAALRTPGSGSSVALDTLLSRGYIDVTFAVPDGYALDVTSVTDAAPEFTLTGAGVTADLQDRKSVV
jgi:hypothetical protein